MPNYAFKAFDARGALVEGRAEAPSKADVSAQVLRQNLRLISAEEVGAGGFWTRDFKFGGRPKARQVVDFVRELATLTEAGLTIDRALRLVAQHAPATLKPRLNAVIEAVVAGSSFSQALGQHRDVFSHDVIEVIAAGEKTRAFPTVLRNLAGSLERRGAIRQRLVSAMVYPAMLVVMSIGAIAVVLTVLVPALAPLFDDPGVTPPPLIRLVNGVNATVAQSWPLILAGIAAAAAGIVALVRHPGLRRWVAEASLRAPLLGPILVGVEAGRLCRVLGTLVSADVSLPAAIAASRTIPNNPVFRDAVAEAGRRMVEGARLSQSLDRLQPYMPVVLNLIATGEQVNRVGEILLHAADMQETESQTRIERLMGLLVPLLTAGMGLTIGGLVFSVMSAILSVNDLATAH
ncbi:type II secretion system F family protein [Lichenihabitans sp. Uapishka_5]|uniref:type II secretion system F family protein n=1 Tax=Lichenihabitans sp. Uapishka_5 TaxID=3037302 RepID=UPI0029E7CCBD|nr:type II secretion system F family protein [Lichenihabitans sp. Uapishka_5]MDX7951714.1 type II secretion system F family protein [Lichenihabitans sp. Uapishka_5]